MPKNSYAIQDLNNVAAILKIRSSLTDDPQNVKLVHRPLFWSHIV